MRGLRATPAQEEKGIYTYFVGFFLNEGTAWKLCSLFLPTLSLIGLLGLIVVVVVVLAVVLVNEANDVAFASPALELSLESFFVFTHTLTSWPSWSHRGGGGGACCGVGE